MKKIFLFAFITVLFFGCKKYENDSSSIHLRTITKRLCGTWKDITYPDIYTFTFKKDGTFTLISKASGSYTVPGQNFEEYKGTWEFSVDKKSILCNYGSSSDTYYIAKLDYKELWFGKTSYVKYKRQ